MNKWMALALSLLAAGAFTTARAADGEAKLGGGVIVDGTMPGAGVGLDINVPGKPIAVNLFFEYYKKSGEKIVPLGFRLLGKVPIVKGKTDLYFGGGGGAGYSASKANGLSITKSIASGVAGISTRAGEKAGFFVEAALHRFLTSSATTDIALRAGLNFHIKGK
jgi:hypothetical protein